MVLIIRTTPTSDIRLTLGSIRTIQINVMGEVSQPALTLFLPFLLFFMHFIVREESVT